MMRNVWLVTLLMAPGTVSSATRAPDLSYTSQDKQKLRQEFEERRQKIANGDADELFALALWAERKGLAPESRRILRQVIKLVPSHEAAHKALGHVQYEGHWLTKQEADALAAKKRAADRKAELARKRKEEADYRKRGYVQHKGEWIKKSDLRYARFGLVRHEGRWVRRSDKQALAANKVRHPQTGTWISKAAYEKAQQGLFELGGEWAPVDRANKFHSTWDDPWEIWTDNIIVKTTIPLDKAKQIAQEAESAVPMARNLVFDPTLPLPERIVVYACKSASDYRDFGARTDATGFSAYGCYYTGEGDEKFVVCNYGQRDWGPYYLKHAVGLGVGATLLVPAGLEPTHWLLTGLGSYVERWYDPDGVQHFGKQYLAKGGVRGMRSFSKRFRIGADQTPADMEWNIYQAGIIVSFLAKGGNKSTRKAWDKVREAIQEGKGFSKALKAFERSIIRAEDDIKEHLEKIMAG